MIRKEKRRAMGRDHINGIEGFWSYAKNWRYPYRGVPHKFFHLYLGEVCWCFKQQGMRSVSIVSTAFDGNTFRCDQTNLGPERLGITHSKRIRFLFRRLVTINRSFCL